MFPQLVNAVVSLQLQLKQDPSIHLWRCVVLCLHIVNALPASFVRDHYASLLPLLQVALIKCGKASIRLSLFLSPAHAVLTPLVKGDSFELKAVLEEEMGSCVFDEEDSVFFALVRKLDSAESSRSIDASPFASADSAPSASTDAFTLPPSSLFARMTFALCEAFPRFLAEAGEQERKALMEYLRSLLSNSNQQVTASPTERLSRENLKPNLLFVLWSAMKKARDTHTHFPLQCWQMTLINTLLEELREKDELYRRLVCETLALGCACFDTDVVIKTVNRLQAVVRDRDAAESLERVPSALFCLMLIYNTASESVHAAMRPNVTRMIVNDAGVLLDPWRVWYLHCVPLMQRPEEVNESTLHCVSMIAAQQFLADGGGVGRGEWNRIQVDLLDIIEYVVTHACTQFLTHDASLVVTLLNTVFFVAFAVWDHA